MSVDAVTVGDAAREARTESRRRRRTAAERTPRAEPPGPRSVVLALTRLGLVAGTSEAPCLSAAVTPVERPPNRQLTAALATLFGEGAIAWDERFERYRLTERGEVLYGPDLRQRPYPTSR